MTVNEGGRQGALRWLWLAAAVIVADQLTKALVVREFLQYEVLDVLPVLELTRLHNTGAAFSLLAQASGWQRWFFIVLAVGISTGIVVWLKGLSGRGATWLAIALSLVMGGALGNVIDRVWHGHVIDFIHFHWERWYYPAFNVADMAITAGAIMLVIDALLSSRRARQAAQP